MVRTASGTNVPDAPSGFRAYSKETALRLNILTRYSYTLETIIQAGKLGLTIISVPVETNPTRRPSRLQRNMWHFIKAQAGTIMRLYAFYEPLRTFTYLAIPFLILGSGILGPVPLFLFPGYRRASSIPNHRHRALSGRHFDPALRHSGRYFQQTPPAYPGIALPLEEDGTGKDFRRR